MKKKNNKGFMLAETLIVTTFVAGVLIFLFIQFTNLSNSYNEYYAYNTTEGLYALEDIKNYIVSDARLGEYIKENITTNNYIELTNCDLFTNEEYCKKLLELEHVKKLVLVGNTDSIDTIEINDENIKKFLKKIKNDGDESYRLISEFNDGSYATIRYGNEKLIYASNVLKSSDPDLYNNTLIPVIYDGYDWKIADRSDEWYNYDKQEWANAVLLRKDINKNIGDTITVDGNNPDILAMFVWIPRYEYKIDGTYGKGGTSAALPGEIEVNFISKATTTPTNGYIIHPAFTFGSTELSGIWVGKFETSHTTLSSSTTNNNLGCSNENCTNADGLRILPNAQSLRNNNVSNFFFASRSMSRVNNPFGIDKAKIDTHMMKNSEWGAVAYLSQSKYGKYGNSNYTGANKEVYINNSRNYYTGRSGGNPGGSTAINETYTAQESTEQYNSTGFYTYDGYLLSYNTNNKTETRDINKGTGASTTGNIYGIYDMSGGAFEYIMGVLSNTNGDLWSGTDTSSNSGFTGKVEESGKDYTGEPFPNEKYYDIYETSSAQMNSSTACDGGICYGHALSETQGWYSDSESVISTSKPWFRRGGYYDSNAYSGMFHRYDGSGSGSLASNASRIILVNNE